MSNENEKLVIYKDGLLKASLHTSTRFIEVEDSKYSVIFDPKNAEMGEESIFPQGRQQKGVSALGLKSRYPNILAAAAEASKRLDKAAAPQHETATNRMGRLARERLNTRAAAASQKPKPR
jgi:hypothetical protein